MKFLISTLLLALTIGCANKAIPISPEIGTQENEKGGLTARVMWMKNKPKSVDFSIAFVSSYGEEIIVKDSSYTLEYKGEKIPIRESRGSSVFSPNSKYEKTLVFVLSENENRQGQVTLTIDPIQSEKDLKHLKPIKFVLPLVHH